jgi:hypothetical protein
MPCSANWGGAVLNDVQRLTGERSSWPETPARESGAPPPRSAERHNDMVVLSDCIASLWTNSLQPGLASPRRRATTTTGGGGSGGGFGAIFMKVAT